jgi:class 3 adenylate cyclase
MVGRSDHLTNIMVMQNRIANLQVVFLDIEKYSQRRSKTQIAVIDSLTECIRDALTESAKQYLQHCQTSDINFQKDTIILPTGDGAAVVFTFDGLHDTHLTFAMLLLAEAYKRNSVNPCELFIEQGWCHCHPNFNLRVGINEGKGIVYKDINNNYNVAGGVINMAARVMSLMDGNQIGFTEESYKQLIDMVDDQHLGEKFVPFNNIKIKHGLYINIYQFTDPALQYLNNTPPRDLMLSEKTEAIFESLREMGLPVPTRTFDDKTAYALVEVMSNVMGNMKTIPLPQKNKIVEH